MKTILAVLVTSVVVFTLAGCAAMQPSPAQATSMQKVPDKEWCAGKYDPTRGTNFGPCTQ